MHHTNRRLLFLFFFFKCLFFFQATASDSLSTSVPVPIDSLIFQINEEKEYNIYDLEAVIQTYCDTTRLVSFSAIQEKTFSPWEEFFFFEAISSVYWVKLTLKSNLKYDSDWRLLLFDQWVEKVDVYSSSKDSTQYQLEEHWEDWLSPSPADDSWQNPEEWLKKYSEEWIWDKAKPWLKQKAGYGRFGNELDKNNAIKFMAHKTPDAISVSLKAEEEKVIYIHYHWGEQMCPEVNIELSPMMVVANRMNSYYAKYFMVIFLIALVFSLAFYNLLIFFTNQGIAYLYYALYGFWAIIYMTYNANYNLLNYQLLFQYYPQFGDWIYPFTELFCILFYFACTRAFLQTKKRFPKLDKIILGLLIFCGIQILFTGLNISLGDKLDYILYPLFNILMLGSIGVFIFIIFAIWKNKQAIDTFYLYKSVLILPILLLSIFIYLILELSLYVDFDIYAFFYTEQIIDVVLYGFPTIYEIAIMLDFVLFAVALGYRTREIELEKQHFQELDTMKSHFFANISHEFRTPLTLVMEPIKQVAQKLPNNQDKNLLQMAYRNAGRLLQLINQLLDLSKLEARKMDLYAKEQDFAVLLKGIVMSFESLAIRKNIRLNYVSKQEHLSLYMDKDKIEKIFYNLLSNAFKFTEEQGEISILLTEQKKHLEVLVRDNGIGISAEQLPHIFNRFYQNTATAPSEQQGTGIGLALVKALVEMHGGTIQVKSTIKKGTTFTILLPKGKAHLQEHQLSKDTKVPETEGISSIQLIKDSLWPSSNLVTSLSPSDRQDRTDLPIVLIIEDNEDVRFYIKQHLIRSFQIIEAIDGQDGLDKALEHLPDLIISDVMMPQKDGYEVCHILKTDQRSSHIPVILLTAKAAQEEKLKGLETGADDYLVKPFDSQELEVRVRNLIELRRQLRQRFSESPTIQAQAIQTNSVDKAFLEKVVTTIENNFSNEQFSVVFLAKAVGMSRVHLNRKLKALTDQSANKFIQSLRLQKALELLQQKKGNVSEIAFEMGFSSTSYFVKCFKDKYGKTPGAVLEE